MKKLLTILLAAALLLPFFTSCVHEWPDETTPADLVLDFKFDTDLPPYLTVHYDTKTQENPTDYDVRYTVEAYRRLPSGEFNDVPEERIIFINDDVRKLDFVTTMPLVDGEYKILAWVDYVLQGTTEHLYYDNSNFKETVLIGKHKGNTDYRDAFVGSQTIKVKRLSSMAEPQVCELQMQRPLAKFDIVATDMEEFLTKQMEAMIQKMREEAERNGTKGDLDTKLPMEIDLDDYTVKIYYVGFMPFSFNIHSNKPNDAKTGVVFESKIKYIDENDASMGFDYIFVNGKESIVQIIMEVYDKEGEKVAATNTIEVPVIRSKLTTVKGKFLTSQASGGVGIKPGFDGEFNIEY